MGDGKPRNPRREAGWLDAYAGRAFAGSNTDKEYRGGYRSGEKERKRMKHWQPEREKICAEIRAKRDVHPA